MIMFLALFGMVVGIGFLIAGVRAERRQRDGER